MDTLGGILTNGLGGDCTAMILGPFRLKVFIDVKDVEVGGGGHAGGVTPVDIDNIRDDIKHDPKKYVRITVKMGKKEIFKEYIVSKNRSEKIVKVANFINKTLQKISVTVNNFKAKSKKITAQFIRKDND
jgi:hypothetical protein